MALAERVKKINPSSTLAITSKAKRLLALGRDIVNFAAGEPDFDTPQFIKDAACEAIKAGFTRYTPTTGIPELKKNICTKFKKDNSLDYLPSQVVVSCGAKHSIFNALLALVDKGDEVLIPSPYWVSYPEMVNLCLATPRFIKASPENNFKITAKELEESITPGTKLLIINSPSNPTGCVYSEEELRSIARICVRNNIFVISDEIYEKIIYDGIRHISIASLGKDIYDLTVTVNGLSKSHAMTGWRIGYLGGRQDIVDAVSNIQDHSTSNPTSISQKAAQAALGAPEEFSKDMCRQFQERRDYIIQRMGRIQRLSFVRPQGAFYVFCNISRLALSSLVVADRLLEEAEVAVIPGEGFGRDDYIRISFATGREQIEKGMDRIEKWLEKQ